MGSSRLRYSCRHCIEPNLYETMGKICIFYYLYRFPDRHDQLRSKSQRNGLQKEQVRSYNNNTHKYLSNFINNI